MVSQAGAMALAGLLPVVHSFACFLSTRPNEQIYNNATEGTKVIYAGSLAGLVPGGPGHSHQSVRDISALGAVPGMALIEPFSEHEARAAVRWAVQRAEGPVYIRLVSVPWAVGFEPPAVEELLPGRGTVLREGGDLLFVAAGPVMVGGAWTAAQTLAGEGVEAAVVSLPWLRGIDGAWLVEIAAGAPIVTLDNHYVSGGLGDGVLAALSAQAPEAAARVHKIGVEEVPKSGENNEVLAAHGLDADSIARLVLGGLRGHGKRPAASTSEAQAAAKPHRPTETRPNYLSLLDFLHHSVQAETYVEIGVARGRSLACALPQTLAIGIDPRPRIDERIRAKAKIFELNSDEFFNTHDLRNELDGKPIALAFIDGLHTFEQTLRDFIHLERFCDPASVVTMHDCYLKPANEERIVRGGKGKLFWSGPWKVILCLREYRPDLQVAVVEVPPTGLGIVTNLDPSSRVLEDRYDEILERFATIGYDYVAEAKTERLNLVPGNWEAIHRLLGVTVSDVAPAPSRG